jgi:hypothetical protein
MIYNYAASTVGAGIVKDSAVKDYRVWSKSGIRGMIM